MNERALINRYKDPRKMVILSSKPHPTLLEDDLIVPSVEILLTIAPIPEPVPVPLKTDESSFEIVEMSGKGQGMVAKRSVSYFSIQ